MKTVEPYTPIQYIMGTAQFCGLDLKVGEGVFIPRPETEILVGQALEEVRSRCFDSRRTRILDLCTGSGAIAIAIANTISKIRQARGLTNDAIDCKIVASDISQDALKAAKANALRCGVSDIIEFAAGDLFRGLSGRFDIIVSNPPYIAGWEFETLQKEVLREPRAALYGGTDGLNFYRRIAIDAPVFLQDGGVLMVEIGYAQMREVCGIFKDVGLKVAASVKDHNGIERVIAAKWINS